MFQASAEINTAEKANNLRVAQTSTRVRDRSTYRHEPWSRSLFFFKDVDAR